MIRISLLAATPVDPAASYLILEREYARHIHQAGISQSSGALAEVCGQMAAFNVDRALQMARSLPRTDAQDFSLEAQLRIAAYLLSPSGEHPPVVWGLTDDARP